MPEETKKALEGLAEVFPTLPPFVQGRIIGTIETAQAMHGRDQPQAALTEQKAG